MSYIILPNAMQSSTDGGLTLREVVADLPTDPASLFAIALFAAAVVFVLWSGRSGGHGGRPA